MLGILKQGRVLRVAHDVLVNFTRLLGLQELGLLHLTIDIHPKIRQHRTLGYRKNKVTLQPTAIGIIKDLLHGGLSNLVSHLDADLLLLHFHRGKPVDPRTRHRPRAGRTDGVIDNGRPGRRENPDIRNNNQPTGLSLKKRGKGGK